jgi:Reverse transcriptase (RNA-dependent DNA polymerase)
MKWKRQVKTREVYKWKAQLAFYGSRQEEGVHNDQTYAPMVSWEIIRLLLAMVLQNDWKTRQLDYVLAFPQAPAEQELYVKIPRGIKVESKTEYALKVKQNLYGQKQAGRVHMQTWSAMPPTPERRHHFLRKPVPPTLNDVLRTICSTDQAHRLYKFPGTK